MFQKSKKETDEFFQKSKQETDKRIQKMSDKIDTLGTLLRNHTNNVGEEAEMFFFRSFEQSKELGGIKFDSVRKNALCKGVEFDIVLVNSTA